MLNTKMLATTLALAALGLVTTTAHAQIQPELELDIEHLQVDEEFFNVENVSSLRNAAATHTDYVCRSGGAIPHGWAATGKATVGGCGNAAQYGFNAFRIVRLVPGNTYAICGSTQPLRAGWVIQQYAYGDACGTHNSSAYVNQVVTYPSKGQTYTVCTGSPLPAGFSVLNAQVHKAGCQPYTLHNAMTIR
ncbi:hypothetical protein [Comamonas sp. JUb58]|uniref:hypothetical protein n=1 Tax=Comamonas sp. JUb58 TaxID=2485114 RepID=UPI00105CFBE1|nr:hypothetical protein [Comamonas sp. JUb58]TDS83676.1 hypothetical protein EDF71_104222 [Comamonas sp. JUb58]